ncbi:unnamed protein product [Pipistrellus nathusii]|uniref:Uncharacterized protein n=1 Tax=Pipistrellus nathusii TaxID=59473 RepID=A0ABN9Z8K1_PIPNA
MELSGFRQPPTSLGVFLFKRPERDMPPRMQFVSTWQLRCSSPAEAAPGRQRSSQPGPGPQPGSPPRPLGGRC